MKKILFLFATIFVFGFMNVKANTIYSIDVNVYVDEFANANITEKWHVKGTNGTEWFHVLRDIGESEVSNFTVDMDGEPLTYKYWNVNESLRQKAGYYGINYPSNGDIELCFGKTDFNEHTFTVKYDISNFVFNTNDAQAIYWTFFPKFQRVDFQNFSVNIRSFYDFPDTLDVWGYGNKGYAYVKNGKISLSNEENSDMNDKYVVLLAKFPSGTYNTTYTPSRFTNFDSVLSAAKEGSTKYDYTPNNSNYNYNNGNSTSSFFDKILSVFGGLFSFIPIIIIAIITSIFASSSGYGYKNNKTIDKKSIPNFRDIPCNKDIYYANALLFLNSFEYKETNILGAIILKWVKEEKVGFIKQDVGLFKKEQNCLDLRNRPTFVSGSREEKLYNIMYEASEDGILEPNEFKRWAKRNYDEFFSVFKGIKNDEVNKLRSQGHIYLRANKEECKKKNVMDDKIYDDSVQLYGLKKFLQEFASMDTKETLEVHIWDEYLMFAYLFGIADQVAKQLKKLYPELIEQNPNMDYTTIMMINNFSATTVSAASSARSAAESYSSGGGGFSSGGGGGGSFGGGGFSGGGGSR